MLGVMLDCSRNAVMKVETVKRYAEIIREMGYDTLMLYTEDTYEIESHPYFGHLRGRYSKAELKEMDDFCYSIGIELIPCIQTLAHLETMFNWHGEYGDIKDCDNILLAGDEKTYKLIEAMISTMSECFRTRKIHIGMDEAYRVGTGKYQEINGIRDRFDVINEHLHNVCRIAGKYGFEPMIWSDMFCRLAMEIENQYAAADNTKILEKADLPENVSLVYWDYYSEDPARYEQMIKTNKIFGRDVYFAGGAWTWKGFAPDNDYSIRTTDAALRACKNCGVDGIFFTVWGDDGSECSKFTVLPSLLYAAEAARGNTDLESIKAKFKKITGCKFDDFMLLDKLDIKGGKHFGSPSKYLFYNDVFMGIRDFQCSEEDEGYYENIAYEIGNVKETGEFAPVFKGFEKLAKVLALKCSLGIKIREAYKKRDMKKLQKLANDCDETVKSLKEFHEAYQKAWFFENKPHGFDVQDIHIGGLIQRILSCEARLRALANGEISEIPELDEPMLNQINDNGDGDFWVRLVSPNRIERLL